MAAQMEVVDYYSLSRRELQNLCKKHGIPANKTNAYMADALSSLSKVNHHTGFGSVNSRTLSEEEGSQSAPCQIKDENEMSDTVTSADAKKNYHSPSKIGPQKIELMEEDTATAVKNTCLDELAGKDAQRGMGLGDATGTSEGQCLMLRIESHADGEDTLGQAYAAAAKNAAEGSENSISGFSPCKETNKKLDCQSNTIFEKRSIDVSALDQKKEVGEKHQEEAIIGNATGYKTAYLVVDRITDSSICLNHQRLQTSNCDETIKNQNHSYSGDRMVLLAGDDATETSKGQCSMLHVESHVDGQDGLGQAYEDADKKVAEGSQNGISRSSPFNQSSTSVEKRSIQTAVDSLDQVGDLSMDVSPAFSEYTSTMKKEVGEKLQEDCNGTRYKAASLALDTKANSSICLNHRALQNYSSDEAEKKNPSNICSSDGMFLLAEETVVDDAGQSDRVYSGHARFKKCPVNNLTAKTSGSSSQFFVECENGIKLSVDLAQDSPLNWMKTCNYEFSLPQDLDDHKHDRGHTLMENTTNGSAKLGDLQPRIPDIKSSANLNQIACSPNFLQNQSVTFTSPVVSTKKPEASREMRRTSSVLIPPHGANRVSSPFSSQKSSRFLSPLISPTNRFLFPSSAVARGKRWTSVNEEIDQFSCLSERSEPMTAEPSKVAEDFHGESGAPEKNGLLSQSKPFNDGRQDVEMAEQSHSSMKLSKNEIGEEEDIQHRGKAFHYQEKETEGNLQVNYSLKKAQKENAIKGFEAEEVRIISRYKDSYKKSPFTKNLRGMKSLARASTMRTDILAKRRAMPFAEKDPAHSQEIQSEHARESLVISPIVYRERDLCVSGLNLVKDPSQNVPQMFASSTLMAPEKTDDLTVIGKEDSRKSSTGISESYQKVSTSPFKAFARRRFLERALAESRERIQAQKMQNTGNNNCFSTEKLSSNIVYAECENQKRKSACILQEINSTNSNIFETENEYSERVTERQKRHREQFKTTLTGKSKRKAIEIAKSMALVQRNEILKSKRGITSGI